jgi:hypothetical protein
MLPTNEKAINDSIIIGTFHRIRLNDGKFHSKTVKGYHLYILSDDEIKEGDWCLCDVNPNVLRQAYYPKNSKNLCYGMASVNYIIDAKTSHKVIATTDKSLEVITENVDGLGNDLHQPLPQPSQSFVEKYIEQYNKANVIEEVLVTYTIQSDVPLAVGEVYSNKPMVSKDNTITIKKIKDSFTREELAFHIREAAYLVGEELENYIKNI